MTMSRNYQPSDFEEAINAFKAFWSRNLELVLNEFLIEASSPFPLRRRLRGISPTRIREEDNDLYIILRNYIFKIEKKHAEEKLSAREAHLLGLLYSETALKNELANSQENLPLEMFQLAIGAGDNSAYFSLGNWYKQKKDFQQANSSYELGESKNDSACLAEIGRQKNNANLIGEAFDYNRRAFDEDNQNIETALSMSIHFENPDDVFDFTLRGIEYGSIGAAVAMGMLFDAGPGKPDGFDFVDFDIAALFFRLGAEMRIPTAMLQLADIYLRHDQVSKAMALIEEAAEMKYPHAMKELGKFLQEGIFLQKDEKRAKKLIEDGRASSTNTFDLFQSIEDTLEEKKSPENDRAVLNLLIKAKKNIVEEKDEYFRPGLKMFTLKLKESEDPEIIFHLRLLNSDADDFIEKFNHLAITQTAIFCEFIKDFKLVKPLLSPKALKVIYDLAILSFQLEIRISKQLPNDVNQHITSYMVGNNMFKLFHKSFVKLVQDKESKHEVEPPVKFIFGTK